ncbi:transposase, partial [Streptomyces sp. NPDC002573]|uniref:transposase n=1 Tax=Streptomyces sp. NPDC002573 TaxID=3364651 RepID=UPI0036AB4AE3
MSPRWEPNPHIRRGRSVVCTLHAHLVFTPKYRRGPFTGEILTRCEEVMRDVCTDFSAELNTSQGGGGSSVSSPSPCTLHPAEVRRPSAGTGHGEIGGRRRRSGSSLWTWRAADFPSLILRGYPRLQPGRETHPRTGGAQRRSSLRL